jgi:dipeptidyl aminopeptidase/acylaminoacyl peptidase
VLRARLRTAVSRIKAPLFFIHARNDYSIGSGVSLDEELRQLHKPHRLKIYPPVGHTPDDGHSTL